jgi:hypothetical protein
MMTKLSKNNITVEPLFKNYKKDNTFIHLTSCSFFFGNYVIIEV